MFQVMLALCPHGQREGGGGDKPDVDRPGQKKQASHEFSNWTGHSLWRTPEPLQL